MIHPDASASAGSRGTLGNPVHGNPNARGDGKASAPGAAFPALAGARAKAPPGPTLAGWGANAGWGRPVARTWAATHSAFSAGDSSDSNPVGVNPPARGSAGAPRAAAVAWVAFTVGKSSQ